MIEWKEHHCRSAYQPDPKLKRSVLLTFYIKSKPGKCKEIPNDRLFLIGIKNGATGNFEEFACEENDWFLVAELICGNDMRQEAKERYIKRLRDLADCLEIKDCVQVKVKRPIFVGDFL
jgi:hypothetical protein